MNMQKRDGLIVWLNHTKYAHVMKRYGYVHYVSKKMKYAVVYCNAETTDSVIDRLEKMKFVRRIERSCLQDLKTTYEKGKTTREKKDRLSVT